MMGHISKGGNGKGGIRSFLPVHCSPRGRTGKRTVSQMRHPLFVEGRPNCARQSLATALSAPRVAATLYCDPGRHANVVTPCLLTPCLNVPYVASSCTHSCKLNIRGAPSTVKNLMTSSGCSMEDASFNKGSGAVQTGGPKWGRKWPKNGFKFGLTWNMGEICPENGKFHF